MKDLVSVLVPCFNHEKYVLKTIESIIKNDYEKIELIFIDDGSTDNSFEKVVNYIDRYKERFLKKTILKQNNQGITKTLNKMLSIASGEYITLVASDDILTKDSISLRVKYLQKNKNIFAVIGKAFLISSDGKILSNDAGNKLFKSSSDLLKKDIRKELVLRWSVVGPTLLLKKSVYNLIDGYDENLKVEDRDFYLRLVLTNKLGYLDKNISYYRIHNLNTSKRKVDWEKRKVFLLEIAKTNIKYVNNFKKIESLYLKTYKIDIFLIEKNYKIIYCLYKIIRKIAVIIYLDYYLKMENLWKK